MVLNLSSSIARHGHVVKDRLEQKSISKKYPANQTVGRDGKKCNKRDSLKTPAFYEEP